MRQDLLVCIDYLIFFYFILKLKITKIIIIKQVLRTIDFCNFFQSTWLCTMYFNVSFFYLLRFTFRFDLQ